MPPLDRMRTIATSTPMLYPLLDGYRRVRRAYHDRAPIAQPFGEIFRGNLWGGEESVSGAGSSMAETERIRSYLPSLLHRLETRTLLDLPCGDFHWMRTVDLGGIRYIGADIVPELVAGLRQRYAAPEREFRVLDATADELPAADAILCRHCFTHLSNRRIWDALANFQRSGARWLLTTEYDGVVENVDIRTGSFRPVDLTAAPFLLPNPLEVLPDSRDGSSRLAVLDLYSVRA